MRMRMERLDSEEGRTDWLAKIYLLLNGRTVVWDFDVLEIEVEIGILRVH